MFKNKKLRLLCIFGAAAAVIVMGILLFFGTRAQQSKEAELEAEKLKRQEQLEKLQLEYENIEARIEYVKSDEFLMRYAREKWGYMLEGDIRFDLNNPCLPEPGENEPDDADADAVETDTPVITDIPSGTETPAG